MNDIVADTHIIVWYLFLRSKLSRDASHRLDQSAQNGRILVSSISIVELVYLIEKGRVPGGVLPKLMQTINDPLDAVDLLPVSQTIAENIALIPRNLVPDMPDRIIAATAISTGLELVTADARIRSLQNVKTVW